MTTENVVNLRCVLQQYKRKHFLVKWRGKYWKLICSLQLVSRSSSLKLFKATLLEHLEYINLDHYASILWMLGSLSRYTNRKKYRLFITRSIQVFQAKLFKNSGKEKVLTLLPFSDDWNFLKYYYFKKFPVNLACLITPLCNLLLQKWELFAL